MFTHRRMISKFMSSQKAISRGKITNPLDFAL